jgi:hypothetical protein
MFFCVLGTRKLVRAFVWNGLGANRLEKEAAHALAERVAQSFDGVNVYTIRAYPEILSSSGASDHSVGRLTCVCCMNMAAEEGAMGPATWTAAFWTTLGGKGTPATAASAGSDAQEESKPTPTCHLYSTSSSPLFVLSAVVAYIANSWPSFQCP